MRRAKCRFLVAKAGLQSARGTPYAQRPEKLPDPLLRCPCPSFWVNCQEIELKLSSEMVLLTKV